MSSMRRAVVLVLVGGALGASARPAIAAQDAGWAAKLVGNEAAAANELICATTSTRADRWSAACYQPALAAMREIAADLEPGPDFDERLCRAMAARREAMPRGAIETTASGAIAEGSAWPDSITVYRLLYLPFATETELGVPDEDPEDGSPWLHQAGLCTAHVMWSERRAF